MSASRDKLSKRDIVRHVKRIVFCIILVLAIMIFVIVWKVFTVETVTVSGNTLYSAKTIEKTLLSDRFSWNSLYVYLKYRFKAPENMEYADHVSVYLDGPHGISIRVNEKEMVGYVYAGEENSYAYLDKDGTVLRLIKTPIENTVKICGLTVSDVELYKQVKMDDKTILQDLNRAERMLIKYGILPDTIYVQSANAIYLIYGKIYVNIGSTSYLNEKIVRLYSILPKIRAQKLTGTLHLETWTESTTDVYFRKKEKVELPDETVQTETKKDSKKNSNATKSDSDQTSKKTKSDSDQTSKEAKSDSDASEKTESKSKDTSNEEKTSSGDSSDETKAANEGDSNETDVESEDDANGTDGESDGESQDTDGGVTDGDDNTGAEGV